MTAADILALAARIEALPADADAITLRKFGDKVLQAGGWSTYPENTGSSHYVWSHPEFGEELSDGDQPNPLTSLEAADAIRPEGWEVSLIIYHDELWSTRVVHPKHLSQGGSGRKECFARTTAALRAIAQKLEDRK